MVGRCRAWQGHHGPWTAHTVGRRQAWHAIFAYGAKHMNGRRRACHAIIALGQHTRTHGRTTSGVACHHRLWPAHTDRRRWACHAIIALKQHTRLNNVGRGMPSPPLDSTYSGTTSGVTCHHSPWTAHSVRRRQPWHAIMALGLHTRLDVVGLGMPS
uniref:Uncharacterized protein n=1 Tax=Solanum lycopersicum TaxID=4081 RepID=A0A3Q7FIQ6_SOLLC